MKRDIASEVIKFNIANTTKDKVICTDSKEESGPLVVTSVGDYKKQGQIKPSLRAHRLRML